MIARVSRVGRIAVSALILLSCGGGKAPSPTPARSVTRFEVVGPTVSLVLRGQTLQLAARLSYSDGSTEDVTALAAWSSSDPSIADVSPTGQVTAVGSGAADISAIYQTHSGSMTITADLANDLDWVFLGGVGAFDGSHVGVYDIVVDPRNSHLLYVASDFGLYVSRNLGATWALQHSAPEGLNPGRLVQDPNNPDRVFYGIGMTLRMSGDQGMTWREVRDFPEGIRSVEVSRLFPGTIYVGLQGPRNSGIFRSTDDGVTWDSHSFGYAVSGETQILPWDIAEDPNDGTLYVATELHDHPAPYRPPAFRSFDQGVTWQNVTGSLPWHGVQIAFQPLTRQVLFLTEGAGLYTSSDRGGTWARFGNASFASTVLVDPRRPTRLLGGDVVFRERRGGVYLSTDSGRTFMPYGLDGRTCGSLALSGDSGWLYAACYNSGIFVRRLP